eukprot:1138605-Pelagomonas_calceolata.AAC.2
MAKAKTFLLLLGANSISDSSSESRDSSISDRGCSSAVEHEPAGRKQAPMPATVARRAAERWALLESEGVCFRCPEWMKLAELVLVVMPGSVEDERMFSALKCLKSPQPMCVLEVGRWLDAGKKRGIQAVGACMLKLSCLVDWSACKAYETMTLSCAELTYAPRHDAMQHCK